MDSTDINLIWWITAVEIPALGGLLWLIWRNRSDSESGLSQNRQAINHTALEAREDLSKFKLDVAKNYVSIGYLQDVERRLTAHLLRIENKLDGKKEKVK